jgi:hypothetical protein
MRLRSLLGRGAVLGCALAALPAQGALAATPSTGFGTIVTTTPSDQVGGLPASSLDDSVGYIPSAGSSAAAPQLSSANFTSGTDIATGSATPATGYDISWPECGGALPPASDIAVVGVDDGHPFSQNPCLQQEAAWAAGAKQHAQYMVVDSPVGWSSAHVLEYAYHGPAGDCTSTDYACQSFNWGYNAAYDDVQYADSQGATSKQWWLDVELPTSTSINPRVRTATSPTSGSATPSSTPW